MHRYLAGRFNLISGRHCPIANNVKVALKHAPHFKKHTARRYKQGKSTLALRFFSSHPSNPLLVFCRRSVIMSPIMGRKRRNGEKRYQKCSDFIADLGRCLRNGSCISAAECGGTYHDGFCLCRLYHIPSDRSVSLSKGFDEPVNGKAGSRHIAALSGFCSGNRIFHRKKSFCPTAHAAGQDWEVQERFGLLALPKLF